MLGSDMCLMSHLIVWEEATACDCVSLLSAQVLHVAPQSGILTHLHAALAWTAAVRMCHPLCQLLIDQL